MQQITDVQTETIAQARPVAAVKARAETRMAYIDMLRMILIIMVIMMHTAITYGAFGDWTYHDPSLVPDETTSVVLSLLNFMMQSFFMALFFFVSGFFTPGSYDRKGPAHFWKDRLLRIALPMTIYTLFLSRLPNYIDAVDNHGLGESFWQFSARTFLTEADGGPTWFLFALLIFCVGYTLWRLASRGLRLDLSWASRLPAPGTKALLAAGLAIAAAMFGMAQAAPLAQSIKALGAFNLLLAFFPSYILLFAAGTLAYRNQWLSRMPARMLRFWGWLSAALIVILPAYMILGGAIDSGLDPFLGGLTWQCAGTCLWFGLACIAFSTTLTLWLRGRVLPQNKLAALAGPNTFAVYLIHPLVLVPLSYAMSYIALPAMVKFLLASALTVIVSYALASLLRRLPGAKAIL